MTQDGRDSARAEISRVPPVLAAVVGLPLLWVGGLIFGHDHVERHLETNVQRALDQRFAGVLVRFDGRDAEVSGILPRGATAAEIAGFVARQEGVRHVGTRLREATSAAPVTSPVLAISLSSDRSIRLEGVVSAEGVRTRLAGAAAAAGAKRVDNRLAVSATVSPIDDASIDGLVNLLLGLRPDGLNSIAIGLRNNELSLSGSATAEVATRLRRGAAEFVDGGRFEDRLTVVTNQGAPLRPPPVSTAPPTGPPPTGLPLTGSPSTGSPPAGPPTLPAAPPFVASPDSLGPVTFATDSAELTSDAHDKVDLWAALLLGHPGLHAEIDGFADSVGSSAHNLLLSTQRAEAVRLALVAKGVDPARLKGRANGESAPVASNRTSFGRSKNRRVQVRFTP
jgi:outer membrane protein OmpA-like peptidoglycan-associated protein